MKRTSQIIAAVTLTIVLMMQGTAAQDCTNFQKKGDCTMDRQKGWRVYSQSKSSTIESGQVVEFNLVFYGQKNYVMSFCTSHHLYPLHFRLLDPGSREVLYDNASDRYLGSLEVGFDVTKSLLIEVGVLAGTAASEEQKSEPGCIGLLIQYENY